MRQIVTVSDAAQKMLAQRKSPSKPWIQIDKSQMLGKAIKARSSKRTTKTNTKPGGSFSFATDLSAACLEEELKALRSENIDFRNIIGDLHEIVSIVTASEANGRPYFCRAGDNESCYYFRGHAEFIQCTLPLEWIRLSSVDNMKAKVLELNQRMNALELTKGDEMYRMT